MRLQKQTIFGGTQKPADMKFYDLAEEHVTNRNSCHDQSEFFLPGPAYRRLRRIQAWRDQYHCLSISGPGEAGDPEGDSRLDLR